MGRLTIVNNRYSEAITTVSESAGGDTGNPATNLLNPRPDVYWEKTDLDIHVTVEAAGGPSWNHAGLLVTNLSQNATWRIRTANDQGSLLPSPVFDTGNMNVWPTSSTYENWPYTPAVFNTTPNRNEDWTRIDIDDNGNPEGVIRVGVLWMGTTDAPARNFGLPLDTGWEIVGGDPSVSRGGTVSPVAGYMQQRLSFIIDSMDASDYKFWERRIHELKKDVPRLWIPHPEDEAGTDNRYIYGTIFDVDFPTMNTALRYGMSMTVIGWR